jgi:hypothetical protein
MNGNKKSLSCTFTEKNYTHTYDKIRKTLYKWTQKKTFLYFSIRQLQVLTGMTYIHTTRYVGLLMNGNEKIFILYLYLKELHTCIIQEDM